MNEQNTIKINKISLISVIAHSMLLSYDELLGNSTERMLNTSNLTLPIPVLIVEDDMVMQQRLKTILVGIGYEEEFLLFSNNLTDAINIIDQQPVSFAIVDLGLPDGNGISFIEQLRQNDPTSLILVFSGWTTQSSIIQAIQAGATGYVLKERDNFEVTLSINSLLRGGAPIDPFIAQHILSKMVDIPKKIELTDDKHILSSRELEILQLVADGLSNKEIAEKIHISRYTVECHIKHIYRKLSVSGRAKAVNIARDIGIL